MHFLIALLMCLFSQLTCDEARDVAEGLLANPSEVGYETQGQLIQAAKDRYEEVGCTTMGQCD